MTFEVRLEETVPGRQMRGHAVDAATGELVNEQVGMPAQGVVASYTTLSGARNAERALRELVAARIAAHEAA